MAGPETNWRRRATALSSALLLALAAPGCAIHGDRRAAATVEDGLLLAAREARADARWDDALAGYERVLFLEPGQPASVYLEYARVLCARHREDDAHELVSRGLSLHPEDIALLAERAELAQRLGFHRAAERDLEQLASIAPNEAAHWRSLGAARLALDLPRAATEPLRRSVGLEPNCREGRMLLADALAQSDDPIGAARLIRECIDDSGGAEQAPGAWLLSGAEVCGRPGVANAEPALARAALEWTAVLVRRDPQNATAFRLAGTLFEVTGDAAAATIAFERASVLDPSDLYSLHHLLRLHTNAGNVARVVSIARHALEFERDQQRRSELLALVARAPR
jgi:tetratricopeptide (TPR) repeat protein